MAESTCHPGEKPLPSVREHKREEPDQTGESTTPAQAREGPLERLEVTMKEGDLNGHCPSPQIHVDLQRQRRGEEVTYGTPGGRVGAPLNRGILPLDNNCWKLTRDVEGG